jgi:hypothetical protein
MRILFVSAIVFMLMIPGIDAQGSGSELSVITTTYDPAPAEPGNYMTLWVRVRNDASFRATNVTLELLDTYPFSIDPSEERERTFGEIEVGESILVRYKVRVDGDAVDGLNSLDFRVSSNGISFYTKSIYIDVESQVVDFAVGSLQSEPESLYSDSENNRITIGLQNIGESAAKLVRTELSLPRGFTPSYSYSETYSIGNIAAESSGNAVFYIDIDKSVDADDYSAILHVFYKDDVDDEYKEKELEVRIPVRSSPSFDITSVTLVPENLSQGAEGVELRLDIINSGSREAENVNVRVLKEATQPFDFDEKSDFVGDLEPGETGQAAFSFDIDTSADLKKYILDIEIRYTTGTDVNVESEKISFTVTGKAPDMTGIYSFAVIFLVIIALVVWYWRR